jgi:hypothetical protein
LGHWRLILKSIYAYLQRKGVSQIKKQEVSGVMRVNINLEVSLHNAFKAATAAQGVDMTTVLQKFIASQRPPSGVHSVSSHPNRSAKSPDWPLFTPCEKGFQTPPCKSNQINDRIDRSSLVTR